MAFPCCRFYFCNAMWIRRRCWDTFIDDTVCLFQHPLKRTLSFLSIKSPSDQVVIYLGVSDPHVRNKWLSRWMTFAVSNGSRELKVQMHLFSIILLAPVRLFNEPVQIHNWWPVISRNMVSQNEERSTSTRSFGSNIPWAKIMFT